MTTVTRENEDSAVPETPPGGGESLRFRHGIRICASFTAVVGFIALLGWITGKLEIASLGSGKIPVAPSTALMLVLYAAALFFRTYNNHRVANLAGLSINVAGALVSISLLLLASQGIRSNLEHLGFTIIDTTGKTPIGHMSPITAFCFLLASLSYLSMVPAPAIRPWRAVVAYLLAGILMTANFLFVLAYLYGTPLFYGGIFIPPAALTCMAFLALGIALATLAFLHGRRSFQSVEPFNRTSYYLLF